MQITKYHNIFFFISLTLVSLSIFLIIFLGLRPSIDFTGGSLLEVSSEKDLTENRSEVINTLDQIFQVSSILKTSDGNYIIRGLEIDNETRFEATERLKQEFGNIKVLRFESIGPTMSRELISKTLTAIVLVGLIIAGYIWKQFSKLEYALSAIIAMIHDVLILLGLFSLFGWLWGVEVGVLFVTAVLTTLAFSIHDTIIIYDRMREIIQKSKLHDLSLIVDTAISQTIVRSFNNSMTTIFALLSLVLLGGESLRWFALALLIGVVVGTYSSIFVASPLLLVWQKKLGRKKLG